MATFFALLRALESIRILPPKSPLFQALLVVLVGRCRNAFFRDLGDDEGGGDGEKHCHRDLDHDDRFLLLAILLGGDAERVDGVPRSAPGLAFDGLPSALSASP